MEDKFFFNPYGFQGPFFNNIPPNMSIPPNMTNNLNQEKISPKDFYENQYLYYRYLNEAMDYQIKSREYFDKVNKQSKAQ